MKKETQILIRVDDTEKLGFEDAADLAGISLSAWARQRLRTAAIQELQQAGQQIAFLKPLPLKK